ncbi:MULTISPECIES: Clp protease N-terminal domain-containing protein [unclassified Curtobacterium]|uniref:Clp protease N-terminal domain-containing protein n=1 Tax=unclassified Curtobacterium TaxID=257496 RepID=UPI0037FF1EB0
MQPDTLSIAVPVIQHGREIVLLAQHESRESGFGFVDAEHLLVAAVVLCGGMPRFRRLLDPHGVTPGRLRDAIRVFVGAGTAPYPSDPDAVTCTPAGARILARSAQVAGPGERVRPHHVLMAVLDGVDDPFMGAAHDVLDRLDVDPRRFRRALMRAARRA